MIRYFRYGELKVLIPLFLVFFPSKTLSLGFMLLYFMYELRNMKFEKNSFFLVLFIIGSNAVVTIFVNGETFLLNSVLYWLFLAPIIFFIIKKPGVESGVDIKRVMEIFISVQILFSVLAIAHRLSQGFSFDVNFGDIIAGTLRNPFVYSIDASNVIFTFSMILILFFYVSQYTTQTNKYLIAGSIFIIFAASVNHLILAAGVALSISIFWRNPVKLIVIFVVVIVLYYFLQTKNMYLILERLGYVVAGLSDLETLGNVSTKGTYIVNLIHDVSEHPFLFFFSGFGAGTYSSRAALFFTGEYVSGFPITNMSEFFMGNTYILWKQMLDAPNWLSGAFHFPYNSLGSILMELGCINSFILAFLFFSKLRRLEILNFSQRFFLLIFILLSALIDNYFEYYQAFFLLYLVGCGSTQINSKTQPNASSREKPSFEG